MAVWFRLPVNDAEMTKDVNNFVGDLGLSMITNKEIHGTATTNVLHENTSKLGISEHAINITKHCMEASKELGTGSPIVNGRDI